MLSCTRHPVCCQVWSVRTWDESDGTEATCKNCHACWHASSGQQLHSTKLECLRKHSAATAGELPSCSWEVLNTCDTETEPVKVARLTCRGQSAENLIADNTCFFCEKPGDVYLQVCGRSPSTICALLDRPINALQHCHWQFLHKCTL